MQLSLERELDFHAEEEMLVPKDESQYLDQPHEEVHGVEEKTHAEPSIINGRRLTNEADRLKLDVAENVGPLINGTDKDNILTDLLDTWLI